MLNKVIHVNRKPYESKSFGIRLLSTFVCVLIIMCSMLVPAGAGSPMAVKKENYANILTRTDINLAIQTTVPRALYAFVELPADWWGWNYTNEQLRSAYLGAPMNYAELSDDGSTQTVDNKVAFPVILNGNIIATILVGKYDGQIYSTYGGATELGEAIAENPGEDFVLFSDNRGAFVVTDENDIIPLQQYPSTPDLSAAVREKTLDKSNSIFELLSTEETIISQNKLFGNTISVQTAQNFYSTEDDKARKSLETKGTAVSSAVLDTGENIMAEFAQNLEKPLRLESASRASLALDSGEGIVLQAAAADNHGTAMGDYLDTYQVVLQGNFNICWAATIASMLRWEMPNQHGTITAVNVVESTTHSSLYRNSNYLGATLAFARTTLDNYLPAVYIVKSSGSARSRAQTRTAINNEDPIYMFLESGNNGHAVANCGFLDWTDGSFTIRIMDPNYSSFQMSEYQSYGSSFYYTTPAGTRYKWTGSIYFNY